MNPLHACGNKSMKTLAVFSQKGGSGKSTIAIHLAVLASQHGRVLLVDADPQGTTVAWGATRRSATPLVVRADPSSLPEILRDAQEEGFELVVLDCPPHAVAGTTSLLRQASHIVVPVQPTMPDIVATHRTIALAKASGRAYSFVINRAPARAAEVPQAYEALAPVGPVCPFMLGDRRAFARALTDGLAVNEFGRPNGKPAIEVHNVHQWLSSRLSENDTCPRPVA